MAFTKFNFDFGPGQSHSLDTAAGLPCLFDSLCLSVGLCLCLDLVLGSAAGWL